MATTRSYIVVSPTGFSCGAGQFAPGERVYDPWLDGQGDALCRRGDLARMPDVDEDDVPTSEDVGTPVWSDVPPARSDLDVIPAEVIAVASASTAALVEELRVRAARGEAIADIDALWQAATAPVTQEELEAEQTERLLADAVLPDGSRWDVMDVQADEDGNVVALVLNPLKLFQAVQGLSVPEVLKVAEVNPSLIQAITDAEARGKARSTALAGLTHLAEQLAAAAEATEAGDAGDGDKDDATN